MRFSQEFIDKVREANDIVEIIGQYTELKGGGQRLMGRCPFPDHSDKSPSFSVTDSQQLYFCYGCKKGGNVFTFLETFNGMSFPEAVEFLARRASIPLPENTQTREPGPAREQRDHLLKINKLAAVFYHQRLKAQEVDGTARAYIKKRGLSEDTVEKFRLGVSPGEWQGLSKFLKSKGAPMPLAESLGLVKLKRNSRPEDSHFDLFRDRLMFPIFSPAGDVIGFGGRTLEPEGLPKYLNSSDSPVFNKSKVLYGIHETGKFIRAADQAIVVEGYMDAISLYAAGIKNVVAILGTAFTPEHAKLLKRYSQNVVMLLDGDEAGLNGAERSLPVLLEAGVMAKGFALPNKMDPDDFVKAEGATKLQDEIAKAPELFTLLLTRRWMQGYHGTPSEKVRIVEEAGQALARAENRQLLELYVLEMARQLDVEVSWVRRTLQAATTGTLPPRGPVKNTDAPAAVPAPLQDAAPEKVVLKNAPKDEIYVLSLLLHHEGLMKEFIEAGPANVLQLIAHPGVRQVLLLASERYQAKPTGFTDLPAELSSQVDDPGKLNAALSIEAPGSSEGAPEEFARKLMSDYLGSLKNKIIKKQSKVMLSQLKDSPSNEQLEEFMNLQRHRLGVVDKS